MEENVYIGSCLIRFFNLPFSYVSSFAITVQMIKTLHNWYAYLYRMMYCYFDEGTTKYVRTFLTLAV